MDNSMQNISPASIVVHPATILNGVRGDGPDAAQQLRFVAQFRRRLDEISARTHVLQESLTGCFQLLSERPNVVGCISVQQVEQQTLRIGAHQLKSDAVDISQVSRWLLPRISDCLSSQMPIVATAEQAGFDCVVVPAKFDNTVAFVTLIQSPSTAQQKSITLALAQLSVQFLSEQQQRRRIGELNRQVELTAATLELTLNAKDAQGLTAACQRIANDLQAHWKCDQVIVGLNRIRKNCKLIAVSKTPVLDRNSEANIFRKAVLDESVGREQLGSWPPLPGIDPHQLVAHKQLARRDSLVISVPLRTRDNKVIGALAMIGRRDMVAIPNIQHAVGAVGQPIAETLETVRVHQGGTIRRSLRWIGKHEHRYKRLLAMASIALMFAAMFIPWTYTIRCQSLLEPVERRFCVAPQDGLIESTLAEPGQIVSANDLLAKMDGREIRWELAGVVADQARVSKQRDTFLASQETAEALMANLEMERLANQRRLLEFRESNLMMNSPIDGVVLSGSLDRRENYPVNKGQVLYEVAPINELRLEVGIPADEISQVRVGDKIEMFVEGLGTEAFVGQIERIRPRAEIRDQEHVFIAETVIENSAKQLRPGMRGVAKIKTREKRIGWILFHRAWERFYAAMPW